MSTSTERRLQRAQQIDLDAIKSDGEGGYLVPSSDGQTNYRVTASSCTCPDRSDLCKHRLAVERLCPPSKFVSEAQPKTITVNVYPPIPIRKFDWAAYLDGQEEGCTGHGETEQEAIDDLKQQLDEQED